MSYYEEIKSRLTMPEVMLRYHTAVNRQNFVLHHGVTREARDSAKPM